MNMHPLLCRDNTMARLEFRPEQNISTNRYTNTEDEERTTIIPGYTELSK